MLQSSPTAGDVTWHEVETKRGECVIENLYDADVCLWILCSADRASRYNRVKKNQFDAQLILSIIR